MDCFVPRNDKCYSFSLCFIKYCTYNRKFFWKACELFSPSSYKAYSHDTVIESIMSRQCFSFAECCQKIWFFIFVWFKFITQVMIDAFQWIRFEIRNATSSKCISIDTVMKNTSWEEFFQKTDIKRNILSNQNSIIIKKLTNLWLNSLKRLSLSFYYLDVDSSHIWYIWSETFDTFRERYIPSITLRDL